MTPGYDTHATSTSATGDTYKRLTVEDVLNLVADLPPLPDDLLNGATVLWVKNGDREAIEMANQLREASGNRLRVTESPHAFPGRIHGFKGAAFLPCVVIHTKEDSNENRVS